MLSQRAARASRRPNPAHARCPRPCRCSSCKRELMPACLPACLPRSVCEVVLIGSSALEGSNAVSHLTEAAAAGCMLLVGPHAGPGAMRLAQALNAFAAAAAAAEGAPAAELEGGQPGRCVAPPQAIEQIEQSDCGVGGGKGGEHTPGPNHRDAAGHSRSLGWRSFLRVRHYESGLRSAIAGVRAALARPAAQSNPSPQQPPQLSPPLLAMPPSPTPGSAGLPILTPAGLQLDAEAQPCKQGPELSINSSQPLQPVPPRQQQQQQQPGCESVDHDHNANDAPDPASSPAPIQTPFLPHPPPAHLLQLSRASSGAASCDPTTASPATSVLRAPFFRTPLSSLSSWLLHSEASGSSAQGSPPHPARPKGRMRGSMDSWGSGSSVHISPLAQNSTHAGMGRGPSRLAHSTMGGGAASAGQEATGPHASQPGSPRSEGMLVGSMRDMMSWGGRGSVGEAADRPHRSQGARATEPPLSGHTARIEHANVRPSMEDGGSVASNGGAGHSSLAM